MTVARSATSAARRAGSKSASRSTRTPRAPQARAIAAKSTGPSSVATPTPARAAPATSGSCRSARCRRRRRRPVPRRGRPSPARPWSSPGRRRRRARRPDDRGGRARRRSPPAARSPSRRTSGRGTCPGRRNRKPRPGPAREVARVGRQDRVVGQDPPERRDRPARVDAGAVPRLRVDDRGRLPGRAILAVVGLALGDERRVEHGPPEQPLVGGLEERLGVGRDARSSAPSSRRGARREVDVRPAQARRAASRSRTSSPR